MRAGRALAVAAAAVVGVGATGAVPRASAPLLPSPIEYDPGYLKVGFDYSAGVIGIGSIADFRVRGPVVVLSARPLHVDPGIEVLAVRATFWGHNGGHSSAGYTMSPAYPGILCWDGILRGHGPTYPIEGLVLDAPDSVYVDLYVRGVLPGRRQVSGMRIEYRLPNGVRQVAETAEGIMDLSLQPRGPLPDQVGADSARCNPPPSEAFTDPYTGFPP